MLRDSEDIQLDNIARTVISNNMADCMISFHWDGDSLNYDKGIFYIKVPELLREMEPVKSLWQKHDALGETIVSSMENDGYKIYMNGYNKGFKDEGIDIIAHKGNEALLIQCKNWKNPPKQRDLKVFIADCDLYIQKNQKYLKNKKIRKIFATSCPQMDGGVGVYLQKYNAMNAVKIEYKQILYNSKL